MNTGFAPDARYVNARVLDSNVGFSNDVQVRNGIGFAIDQGADVLNLSLNYFATFSSGNQPARLDARLGGVFAGHQLGGRRGQHPDPQPRRSEQSAARFAVDGSQSRQLVQRDCRGTDAARLLEGQLV